MCYFIIWVLGPRRYDVIKSMSYVGCLNNFIHNCGFVQVTIAQYSSLVVKEGSKNKTVGQFQIIGKAWDNNLGGFNFDLVITEILADRFNAIWNKKKSGAGKDVRDFVRPMTKLRVEATKLREILSANQEMSYKAEQLHAGRQCYNCLYSRFSSHSVSKCRHGYVHKGYSSRI